jgi:L-iditol 2-dehydrogenase
MKKNANIPEKMKAAFLTGQMQIDIRWIDVPQTPPGGALIKVHSVGLCGSDINRIQYTSSENPRVLGHEITGEIYRLDPNVTDFQVGDRVAVGHVHVPCQHCDYCRHGSPAMCRQFKSIHVEPGGYAEYVALTHDHLAHSVLRVPERVSDAAATFIDPLGCCMRAVRLSDVLPFDRVVVVGTGIMGQLFVMLLNQLHTEVIAVDISPYRLEKANEFGAHHTIQSSTEDVVEKVLDISEGQGADSVFLTFLNQKILDQALSYVRDGGDLCVFAPPIKELKLEMDYFSFFRRELRLFSSYSSNIDQIETAMKWIASKKIDVEALITGTTDLDNLLKTVEDLDEEEFKIIVKP